MILAYNIFQILMYDIECDSILFWEGTDLSSPYLINKIHLPTGHPDRILRQLRYLYVASFGIVIILLFFVFNSDQ